MIFVGAPHFDLGVPCFFVGVPMNFIGAPHFDLGAPTRAVGTPTSTHRRSDDFRRRSVLFRRSAVLFRRLSDEFHRNAVLFCPRSEPPGRFADHRSATLPAQFPTIEPADHINESRYIDVINLLVVLSKLLDHIL